MSFDYDKIKAKTEEGGSVWTSYSDLFMMLSVVFLLLYVVASIRSGTNSIQKNIEYQRLAKKAEDLEEQIRVYNTLKDEQLQHGSSDEEQQVYHQLMGKLELLQEEAKDEKEKLRQQARENEQKEFALNKYQQMIRNIINTNILAKSQIKRRDETIVEKRQIIGELQEDIQEKQQAIAQNEQEITKINNELKQQMRRLELARKRAKVSKAKYQQEMAKIQKESESQIQELQQKSYAQRTQLIAKLEKTKQQYQTEMDQILKQSEAKLAQERRTFEENLKKQKLSAAETARRQAEFQAEAKRKAEELQSELAELGAKVQQSEGQLADAKAKETRYLASIEGLKKEKSAIADDLKQAKERMAAKQNLIKAMKGNFARAGIKAEVDGKTGDVILSFGEDYFDTGSAVLKSTMADRLEEFVPAYTKSLFSDPKIASKLENVEIIGFASSTYRGKYVNPTSLKPEHKDAINYNLKLSFARANSIFKYIFDKNKLQYQHQQDLLPLVKVVGRGYLPEGSKAAEIPDGISEAEFCKKYNCKAAQKVVVKFKLKD